MFGDLFLCVNFAMEMNAQSYAKAGEIPEHQHS